MPRNTSVVLGEYFEKFVAQQIAQGRYQSVSEAVRAGLRRLEEDDMKREFLRTKLQAGEDSPLVKDFSGRAFIEKMHAKHTK
ncbi:type II toxin-antitoxin system ParD family antitoxin [Geoalkalibacter halelectricus]|uniref:type II toxin-antitoxin system ParD family antitoxin n=1 Tax=Geoalkalibacter halelectricus TaxID=2847045 RepID=UPI003D1E03EB